MYVVSQGTKGRCLNIPASSHQAISSCPAEEFRAESAAMFPTINETRFNGIVPSTGNSSLIYYSNVGYTLPANGHRSLSEEEQHLYNHHIIENFVESVREMNDVVLIPSKLKDLDLSTTGMSNGNFVTLNDDLYSYYQMINVVKNDLFEPHKDFEMKKHFLMPKRKMSRQHRREQEQQQQQQQTSSLGHHRNLSSSSLSNMSNGYSNGVSGHTSATNQQQQAELNGDSMETMSNGSSGSSDSGTIVGPTTTATTATAAAVPLSSEQLIGQSAKQMTVQFIHHLHSLYTILEHFTSAADFITERYTREVETL